MQQPPKKKSAYTVLWVTKIGNSFVCMSSVCTRVFNWEFIKLMSTKAKKFVPSEKTSEDPNGTSTVIGLNCRGCSSSVCQASSLSSSWGFFITLKNSARCTASLNWVLPVVKGKRSKSGPFK